MHEICADAPLRALIESEFAMTDAAIAQAANPETRRRTGTFWLALICWCYTALVAAALLGVGT